MNTCKRFLSVFLMAAVLLAFGSESVHAKNSLSNLVKGADAVGKSDLVVVIDAGHGGYDSGATGNGLYEKLLTLKIAKYCQAELSQYKGVKVYMTRTKDVFVSLDNRVLYAAKAKADVFVSIHINSASPSANGAEVFYPNSSYRPAVSAQGQKLARAIQNNLAALGLKNRGIKTLNSMTGSTYVDGSPADYYAVIKGSKKEGFPGIIVEHAFISNASDAKIFLSSNAKLKKLGVADAKGIAACYGLKKAETKSASLKKTSLTRLIGKTSKSVSLEWKKVEGASGYEIYRSASKNGTYQRVAAIKKAGTVSYVDKSVKSGKTYYYKVRPYKTVGGSKETAGFCAAQKVKLLKKPALSVKNQSSFAKLNWQEVSGAVKYELYRSASKDGKFTKIASVKNSTAFKDTARKSGEDYYYKVRAVSSGIQGNTYSSYSAVK